MTPLTTKAPAKKEMKDILFAKPYVVGSEIENIFQAISSGHTAGDGSFTKKCQLWLQNYLGCHKVLLTHSCTAALEMSAILADIQPGDEVIMPSYTFVSTANSVVLRGGIPVFVDIRPDTLNLDETKVEAAITPKTKAIFPVHYAGVGCEMDSLLALAKSYNLAVIEDAAQAFGAGYKGKPLGSFGNLAAFSFHATKNVVSGEGGALIVNDPELVERAEIIWEKGTNRSKFFRGQVDKYTWVDIGSSYLPSELVAAFLFAQLEKSELITQRRLEIWRHYHDACADLEAQRKIERTSIPNDCQPNAHIYYFLVKDLEVRTKVLSFLKENGVQATFHYVPLHSAPAGRKYGRVAGDMSVTEDIADRIVRLPMSASLTHEEADYIMSLVFQVLG